MKFKFASAILLILLFFLTADAVQFLGGQGLMYTTSSVLNEKGQLNFNFYLRGYQKTVGNDEINNGASCLCINLGISDRVELGLSQIIYQDVHFGKEGEKLGSENIPGNSLFALKVGKFNIGSDKTMMSFMAVLDYRSGEYFNIYLEPYYNYGVTGHLHAIFSYYTKPFAIEESNSVHLNLGYINHNDQESISGSAQTFAFSLGALKSTLKTEYSLEFYGRYFLTEPLNWAYSRETFVYITPAFKYKFTNGFSLGFAFDVLIHVGEEISGASAELSDDYPQMSEWRANIKLGYNFPRLLFGEGGYKGRKSVGVQGLSPRRATMDQKALFEWVVDENQGAQYIDLELEKIREERKRAEEELNRLKVKVEEAAQKKKEKEEKKSGQ